MRWKVTLYSILIACSLTAESAFGFSASAYQEQIKFSPPEEKVRKIDRLFLSWATAGFRGVQLDDLDELDFLRKEACLRAAQSCISDFSWMTAGEKIDNPDKAPFLKKWWDIYLNFKGQSDPQFLAKAWVAFTKKNGQQLNFNSIEGTRAFIQAWEQRPSPAMVAVVRKFRASLKVRENTVPLTAAQLYSTLLRDLPLDVNEGRQMANNAFLNLKKLPAGVRFSSDPAAPLNAVWNFATRVDSNSQLAKQIIADVSAHPEIPPDLYLNFVQRYGPLTGDLSETKAALKKTDPKSGSQIPTILELIEASIALSEGNEQRVLDLFKQQKAANRTPTGLLSSWNTFCARAETALGHFEEASGCLDEIANTKDGSYLPMVVYTNILRANLLNLKGDSKKAISVLTITEPKLDLVYTGPSQYRIGWYMEMMIAHGLMKDKISFLKYQDLLKKNLPPGKSFETIENRFALISNIFDGGSSDAISSLKNKLGPKNPLVKEASALSEIYKKNPVK